MSDGLGARQSPDLLLRRKTQVLHAAFVNYPELIAETPRSSPTQAHLQGRAADGLDQAPT